MAPMAAKVLAVALLVLGEAVSIFTEITGARAYASQLPFVAAFGRLFPLIALAGGLLISGYMLGVRAFQNIWIVSAVSITAILVIEPVLDYVVFRQMPTTGAVIGLVLGAAGFLAALAF